jgi:hypothetical protein
LQADVAKQRVRIAKEELKRARKRLKEAKRENKRARKQAAAARKAWKKARRGSTPPRLDSASAGNERLEPVEEIKQSPGKRSSRKQLARTAPAQKPARRAASAGKNAPPRMRPRKPSVESRRARGAALDGESMEMTQIEH